MTVPVAVLLAFAAWTLITLTFGIGLERGFKIASRRAKLTDFPADTPHGSPLYRRAMRAHANCVENLPLFGAVVIAAVATGTSSPALDLLALTFLGARIMQTLVHVLPTPNSSWGAIRFTFFLIQLACMVAMGTLIAVAAAPV